MQKSSDQTFPFVNSRAANMLREGIRRQAEQGRSIRSLGKALNYKQAVVLSHMANGRVPVPLERAPDIARATGLDPSQFLAAAVAQRNPEAADLLGRQIAADRVGGIAFELAAIADAPLDALNEEQQAVLREVVADPRPRRRWLAVAELPAVLSLRQARPRMVHDGLSGADLERILDALLDAPAGE